MYTNSKSQSPISKKMDDNKSQYSPQFSKTKGSPIKSDRLSGQSRVYSPFKTQISYTREMPTKSAEIQIYHMDRKYQGLTKTYSDLSRSPIKNPILQNDEQISPFKPSCKRIPGAGETTMFNVEEYRRNAKLGECHPSVIEPKKEQVRGLKKINFSLSKSYSEVKKRELKPVEIKRPVYNPITEGDPASIKPIKMRKIDQEISEHYAKHSEKKYLLPADRIFSPKKLYNGPSPTKVRLNLDDLAHIQSSANTPQYTVIEKPHPLVEKHKGYIRDVLQYQDAPSIFRENAPSDKVNHTPVKLVNENLNKEKIFSKKKCAWDQQIAQMVIMI